MANVRVQRIRLCSSREGREGEGRIGRRAATRVRAGDTFRSGSESVSRHYPPPAIRIQSRRNAAPRDEPPRGTTKLLYHPRAGSLIWFTSSQRAFTRRRKLCLRFFTCENYLTNLSPARQGEADCDAARRHRGKTFLLPHRRNAALDDAPRRSGGRELIFPWNFWYSDLPRRLRGDFDFRMSAAIRI